MKKRLQVFISSTYTDLLAERQAAVSAILKAGHIPAGMELFTAGDESQMEIIKRWIDESDVYMLILGGRYGSVEPITKLSYTELEYDYAVEKRKPLFAVVITDPALEAKVKIEGTSVIERERPQELNAFRAKVLSRISSFFATPQDIRLAVYETLAEFVQRHEFSGWVSAADIPDTNALATRVTELFDEKTQLQKEVESLRAELQEQAESGRYRPTFRDLVSTLESITLQVPEAAQEVLERSEVTALGLLNALGERLIAGIYNGIRVSNLDIFLYHQLMPRLQLYDLAESEAVPEVAYRRYALTRRGVDFLSFVREQMTAAEKTAEN